MNEDPECTGCAPAQKFKISYNDVKVHEQWNIDKIVTDGNDIILIRLPELAMTNREDEKYRVVPVCLAYKSLTEYVFSHLIQQMHVNQMICLRLPTGKSMVAGWGRNQKNYKFGSGDFQNSGAYTPNLLKLVLPVYNATKCKEDYKIFKSISSEKHLCAGGVAGKNVIQMFHLKRSQHSFGLSAIFQDKFSYCFDMFQSVLVSIRKCLSKFQHISVRVSMC